MAWTLHYKIKCLNKIDFNPFCKYRVREGEKKLTLPKPNQCRSIHGSAAYVLEITSLLGIALLALIDDKFMSFLLSFTIFGFFKLHHKHTQNQAVPDFDRIPQHFSSFHGYKIEIF